MSHTYSHKRFEYPSVTTVLSAVEDKSGLIYWAVDVALEYGVGNAHKTLSEFAMTIGSSVHSLIEGFLNEQNRHGV